MSLLQRANPAPDDDEEKPLSGQEGEGPGGMATEAEFEGHDNPEEEGEDEKKKKPDTDDDEPPPPYSKDDPQDDKNDDAPQDDEGVAEATNAQPKLDTGEQTEQAIEQPPQPAQMETMQNTLDTHLNDDIDYPHMDTPSPVSPTSPISPALLSRISSPPKGHSLSDLTRIKPEDGVFLSQPVMPTQRCSSTDYRRESTNEFSHESLSSSDNTIVNSQSQPSQSELGPESTCTATSGNLSHEYNSTPVYVSSPSSDMGQRSIKVSKNSEMKKVKSKDKRTKGKRQISREYKDPLTNDSYPSTPTQENLSVNYSSPQGVLGSSQESSSCFENLSPEQSDVGEHLSEADTEPREIRIRKSGSGYGINLTYDEKSSCIVVKSLSSNGAVGRDGRIRAGDRITAINGKSLAGLNVNKAKGILKRASTRSQELIIAYTPAPQLHNYILPSMGGNQYMNTPGTRSSISEGIVPTPQTNYYPSPMQGAQSGLQMHPVMAPGPQYPHGMLPGMWHMDGAPTYHSPGVPPPALNVQGGYFPQYEEQMSKPPPPPYVFPHQPGPSPAQPMLSQGPHPYPTQPPQQSWNLNTANSNGHILQHSPNMGGGQWPRPPGMSHSHMTPGPVHREPPQYNDIRMMAMQPSQPPSQQQPLNVGGPSQPYVRQQPPQSTHFVSPIDFLYIYIYVTICHMHVFMCVYSLYTYIVCVIFHLQILWC